MDDGQPMQADGKGSEPGAPDGVGDTKVSGKNGSESQGAAYPNPHSGKKPSGSGHGEQSEIAYHGSGQLGEQQVGENENAVTKHND